MSRQSVGDTPTRPAGPPTADTSSPARFAGIAFIVFFLASVVASSVPANNASDAKWIAAYTGHSHQAGHLATGVLLVLAALSLMTFLVTVWGRIAQAQEPTRLSPVPLVASAISAACIAVGGVAMAAISGTELFGKFPLPSVDLLQFSNDLGFALVAVGGMLTAAFSVACLSVQGRSAGVFSRRTATFGVVVAVILLASVAFVPMAALWLWVIVVTVQILRKPAAASA